MKKDNIFKILSIIVITFILLLFYSKIHQCNWNYCPHKGKLMISSNFISYWGYEEDTDGYLCEYTHFMNPSWTYEECEDYVFSQP